MKTFRDEVKVCGGRQALYWLLHAWLRGENFREIVIYRPPTFKKDYTTIRVNRFTGMVDEYSHYW